MQKKTSQNGTTVLKKAMADERSWLMSPDGRESEEYELTNRISTGDTANSEPAATFTTETALEAIGFGKFQVRVTVLAGLCYMADAMEATLLSVLSIALHCQWRLQTWQEALISSIVFAGSLASSSFLGSFSDKFGRRVEVLYCLCCLACFTFLSAFSPNFYWMLTLRSLVGLSLGGAGQAVTLLAECLPKKQRGKAIYVMQMWWGVGGFLQSLVALLVMPLGWSYMVGIMAAIIFFVCCLGCKWLPESPFYHSTRGDLASALKLLKEIARINGKDLPQGTLHDPCVRLQAHRGQLKDIFTKSLRVSNILIGGMFFCVSFSYVGTIMLSTTIFEKKRNPEHVAACFLECDGLSTSDYVSLMWTSIAEIPFLLSAALVVDLIGRKKTTALYCTIYVVSVFFVFASSSRVFITLSLFVARGSVNAAYVTLFIVSLELNPTACRGMALGYALTLSRIGALLSPFVAQVLLKVSSGLALSIYGAAGVMIGAMALLLPHESAGKSLNDDECFGDETDARNPKAPEHQGHFTTE